MTTDYYKERVYNDEGISISTLEMPSFHLFKMVQDIGSHALVEMMEDPAIVASVLKERKMAFSKGSTPWRDVLYGRKKEYEPGKKWIYVGYPSIQQASYYHVDWMAFKKIVMDGMSVTFEEMQEKVQLFLLHFNGAKKITVRDELGTDFWVSVEGRQVDFDDGYISDEKLALGMLGANLPSGECEFAPVETIGEGVVICPVNFDRYFFKSHENVELPFKNGKLLIDKITADTDIDDIINVFKFCEDIDREKNRNIRTYNIAELGFGCNPRITKSIGYILSDEKVYGSAHLAFGSNTFLGVSSGSQLHWDFVRTPKVDGLVEYMDGTESLIMEKGKLIEE